MLWDGLVDGQQIKILQEILELGKLSNLYK